MYIVDGIAYGGAPTPSIKVSGVRPLKDHKLWVRFTTGMAKIVDLAPLITTPAFAPLADEDVFRSVYIDPCHGLEGRRDRHCPGVPV